jgi:hypothetical protein
MLTPLQFKFNYLSLLADSEIITGVTPCGLGLNFHYNAVTEKDSLTTLQWDNLVKVASIIESNADRFDMTTWHNRNECGTAHCIAGWAESLAMNDTNYYKASDTIGVAVDMLSDYVKPFFWITTGNLVSGCSVDIHEGLAEQLVDIYEGLAEQLVMKWFIKPILEEARRESYELSNEIAQFIQKTKEETQVKELITA